MLKDDGMDKFLIEMVSDRGDEVAHQKAEASEEYIRWKAEQSKAWERLSESFTLEQRRAYIDYERAEASVQEITERYYYAQGLKDGIALSHVV